MTMSTFLSTSSTHSLLEFTYPTIHLFYPPPFLLPIHSTIAYQFPSTLNHHPSILPSHQPLIHFFIFLSVLPPFITIYTIQFSIPPSIHSTTTIHLFNHHQPSIHSTTINHSFNCHHHHHRHHHHHHNQPPPPPPKFRVGLG